MKALYIFLDESGNFDFSPNGTKYFILTSLSTSAPFGVGGALLRLRYNLLPNYACGSHMADRGHFHASEDIQTVRDAVFEALLNLDHDIRIDSVVAQKNKAKPEYHQQPVELYRRVGEALLKYSFIRVRNQDFDHVVMVFSSIFDKKKRGILKQAFKSLLKQFAHTPFSLYFHDSKFDPGSQAVDYFGWAIYRKWESSDLRSYNPVSARGIIHSEFDIFSRGEMEYYPYKQ